MNNRMRDIFSLLEENSHESFNVNLEGLNAAELLQMHGLTVEWISEFPDVLSWVESLKAFLPNQDIVNSDSFQKRIKEEKKKMQEIQDKNLLNTLAETIIESPQSVDWEEIEKQAPQCLEKIVNAAISLTEDEWRKAIIQVAYQGYLRLQNLEQRFENVEERLSTVDRLTRQVNSLSQQNAERFAAIEEKLNAQAQAQAQPEPIPLQRQVGGGKKAQQQPEVTPKQKKPFFQWAINSLENLKKPLK